MQTVKQLARAAGGSVRTLHHYDAVGLLKPADVGPNGYRHYGRPELLRLQQILFDRELSLNLQRIRVILDDPGFETLPALLNHQAALYGRIDRSRELLSTIDRTIESLWKER